MPSHIVVTSIAKKAEI